VFIIFFVYSENIEHTHKKKKKKKKIIGSPKDKFFRSAYLRKDLQIPRPLQSVVEIGSTLLEHLYNLDVRGVELHAGNIA